MAIIMGQWAIAGTTPTTLTQVPPGRCSVTFYSTAATGQLYLGLSATLSATNGYGVTTTPTAFQGYTGSRGALLYGLNTAATTLPVNYIISTES